MGQWLAGASYQVVRTAVNGRDVTVVINGAGKLRPLQQLADDLASTLGRPMIVDLRVIPSQSQKSGNYTPQ